MYAMTFLAMNSVGAALPRFLSALLVLALATACSVATTPNTSADADLNYGVLVMAHGGGEQWDAAVIEAVEALESEYPTEIAFGMADAGSMEDAVRRLEQQGVEHVGVVRLFISGESWYERTEQILGLKSGAPAKPAAMAMHGGHGEDGEHGESTGHVMPMGFWEIDTALEFHMSEEGLADAEEMDQVLVSRIQSLSQNPANEVAIVLAHGPGDDAENERWIAKIGERTELAAREIGISDIKVFTLREDWQAAREEAEQQIRAYLSAANAEGKDVLVVPYRVMGFGPYHDVLAGLDYRADETGLLPHDNVNLWLINQARELAAAASAHQAELLASMP